MIEAVAGLAKSLDDRTGRLGGGGEGSVEPSTAARGRPAAEDGGRAVVLEQAFGLAGERARIAGAVSHDRRDGSAEHAARGVDCSIARMHPSTTGDSLADIVPVRLCRMPTLIGERSASSRSRNQPVTAVAATIVANATCRLRTIGKPMLDTPERCRRTPSDRLSQAYSSCQVSLGRS